MVLCSMFPSLLILHYLISDPNPNFGGLPVIVCKVEVANHEEEMLTGNQLWSDKWHSKHAEADTKWRN